MFPEQNLNQLTGIQELFGSDLPWIGALTFGELSPLGGCNYLHNYTGTMVLIHD
jgi:small ligand-binding sensory domain FIST